MPYRLVLWDFDGTLADSMAISLTIINRLALQYRFKPITDPYSVRKMTVRKFMKEHKIGFLKLPRITKAFQQALRQEIEKVPLYPGLIRVLKQTHAAGVRHAILSSNSPENIQAFLLTHGITEYFEFTAGCFKLLGKARGIKRVIKQHKIPKKEVLYVGDEVRDVAAAHKAGIDVAAVSWGINDWNTLAAEEPTHQVATPEELLVVATSNKTPSNVKK
ncbi:MAG: HAD-IA family hydrolase [Gemmatales bacterium]